MRYRILASIGVLAIVIIAVWLKLTPVTGPALPAGTPAQTWTPVHLPDGHPDLQGVWSFATLTPLERPAQFAGKPFLTDAEAAEYSQKELQNLNADRRDGAGVEAEGGPGEDVDVRRAYNEFWYDRGKTVVGTRRTSLIIDPPDGKLPPLTPEGQKRANALATFLRQEVRGPIDGVKTRPLRERCIWWETEGPPITPMTAYNAYFQLVQTQDHVAMFIEMIHDVRMISLDGRPHLPRSIPQLLGDSRGHWEGDTLVIDTTNFKDKAEFIDPTSFTDKKNAALLAAFRGSGPNLHLIERLTRVDADTLRYEYTMEDPTTWTRPWTAQQLLTRVTTPIYEYACHEANYGMAGILSGARAQEKAANGERKGFK